MGEITVRAETNVLGLKHGETQTIEDTPFLRKVIAGGRLSIVESTCADTAASTEPAPDPAPVAGPPLSRPPAKTRRKPAAAEQPVEDAQGDAVVEVIDGRVRVGPPDAVVTVRSPDLPPAA